MDHRNQALSLMREVPLIDGHNDWPHLIRAYYHAKLDQRFEYDRDLAGHVDIKRLRQGKVGGTFWSAYVDCPPSGQELNEEAHYGIVKDTLQQIDLIYRLIDRYPNELAIATNAGDILNTFGKGKVASLIGVEGLHQIGNSSSVLRMYYRLGVRYLTLAHSRSNFFADSATAPTPVHQGLSDLGQQIITEMNRLGMLVDLSHSSEEAAFQALTLSQAPVMFSHSSVTSVVPHPRNVSDRCLEKLKHNRGIIMISLIPALTSEKPATATLEEVLDHIIYVAGKIGYDFIGIGSDFDGMVHAVKGIEDVSKYPDLVAAMLQKGIEPACVKKIIGLNLIRVLTEVEDASKRLHSVLHTMEDTVEPLWDANVRTFVRSQYPCTEE